MKVLTCNIRYEAARDGEDSWPHRQDLAAEIIQGQEADIVCFQELSFGQRAFFARVMTDMTSFGFIDQPQGGNPTNAIFYRRDAFEMVAPGGYWLSRTPHVAGSSSWESDCVRLCNWLRLRHRATGREMRILNTHLDHISQLAREEQARLINEDALAFPPDYGQILTGDMNCDAANPAMQRYFSAGWLDTHRQVHGAAEPGFTYHGFQGPNYVSALGKMDFVLCRGALTVRDAQIMRDQRDGRYPSDHYFVSAEFVL